MKKKNIIALTVLAGTYLPAEAQSDSIMFDRTQSTASVSVISAKHIGHRSAKDIGNDIVGQGLGLISKQASGNYASANPTFYVRGLQSLSSSAPLVLVDGIERDIKNVAAEEVEEVKILKDAAAVALYGYKGVNGVVLVTTKRGQYNSKSVTVTYDHIINFMRRKPKFVDAYTYAQAVNEARGYENLDAAYGPEALAAFRDGTYPNSYPNVDWVDETFRNTGVNNRINVEFRGGSNKFRYFTLLNLLSDKGFVKNTDMNDGYSTQNKYVKGNVRMNLDADLTPTTKMQVNVLGVLAESSRPGSSVNLWDLVYTVPSAAFPIKSEDDVWGGNATWNGYKNPVAQAQGAAYAKNHTRSLFADVTLTQDLSSVTQGLGLAARVAYDNTANIYENHSRTYIYGMDIPTSWQNGQLITTRYGGGEVSEMGTSATTNDYAHLFHFNVGVDYKRSFGCHDLYSQLRWDYENHETYGTNSTLYRQDYSLYTHYAYNKRYLADLALVVSGSNRLAPGHKWSFSPTLSLGWVLSEENFLKGNKIVNFLKLRASAGIINADYLPENTWTYYLQSYNPTSSSYMFTNTYSAGGIGVGTTLGRMATTSSGHEKAYKYNVGIDGTFFGGLDMTLDAYKQHRTDIWVSSDGKYTDVVGFSKPYENAGVVNSWGIELGLDYSKNIGKVDFNVGGNLNYNRSKVKEKLEQPRLYANRVETGHSLNQTFGLIALGFFKDEADIANSPKQTFSTVRPGDVKYLDVNGDGVIDANDNTAIGYNTVCPELFYNFHFSAEWKGLGIYAMLQGVGRYSALLTTKGMFKPLIDNTTLSCEYYDNRWTPDNQNAKYPRLSSESNVNNYQTSTLWLADRSYLKLRDLEIYYRLPKKLLEKTKFVSAAKIYVRGTDLFTLDHIKVVEPENYGATNPMTTSVVAGLSVTF